MNGRTLNRRLNQLETRINPTAKPGITVIVVRAGEPEADLGDQNVSEGTGPDD